MSRKRRPAEGSETELILIGPSPDGKPLDVFEVSAPLYAALKRAGLNPFAMDFLQLARLCDLDALIDLDGDNDIRVQPLRDYDDIAEFDLAMLTLGLTRYIRRTHESDRLRPRDLVFTPDGKPAADAEVPRSHVVVSLIPRTRSRAEGDKSIVRSERRMRLSSAVEWLAGEVKPPGGRWQSSWWRRPQVSPQGKCRWMPRSILPKRVNTRRRHPPRRARG
jgi:hypothetical protein